MRIRPSTMGRPRGCPTTIERGSDGKEKASGACTPPSLQGRSSREGSPATLVPPCQLIWQCDTLMRLLVYRATEAAAAAYDAHVHHARPHHEPESQCNSNSTAS